MIVVSNTTPLIGLESIQRFNLLQQLFGELIIPEAVYDEFVVGGRERGGAKYEVLSASWIRKIMVNDRSAVEVLLDELDLGESETIVLACEINAHWVLMDEKKGRRKLAQLNMNKMGTVGILLKAKQLGLIPVVQPEIERLCQQGFGLSQSVIEAVLRQANELS